MLINIALLVFYITQTFCQEPVVETEYGKIRGIVKQVNGKPYTAFLGVPYAAPPIGNLRFAPPQRHAGWTNILDVQEDKNSCPQDRLFEDYDLIETVYREFPQINFTQDEDCLFLNIYITGELPKSTKPQLPVFFVIHGGGNAVGSMHWSPGQVFVTEGEPIILVMLQYRLGALGFMTSGDEHLPGMNGLKDQSFALRWIQNNIAAFGGDPNHVTINGESAGGENALNHMISPMSRGLFHRCISQSPPSAWRYAKPSSMRKYFLEFAQSLNCDGTSQNILQCLRSKTWQELKNAEYPQMFVTQRVIDGEFMPDSPHELWSQGQINNAELIYGITDDDGDIAIRYFGGEAATSFFDKIETDKQLDVFESAALNLLNFLVSDKEILDTETITQYDKPLTNYNDLRTIIKAVYFDSADDSVTRARRLLDMSTHCYFLAYGYWVLNQVVKNSGSARMYLFSHRSKALGEIPEGALKTGTFHGSDIPYQFGFGLDSSYGLSLTDEEKQLARSVIKAWTSFAARKPSFLTASGEAIDWPEYTFEHKNVLLFNTNMSQDSIINAEDKLQPALDFWLALQSLANIGGEIKEDSPDFSKKDEF